MIHMRVCVIVPNKGQIFLADRITFNEENLTAELIVGETVTNQIDLTVCELKKLNLKDNMSCFEIVAKSFKEGI